MLSTHSERPRELRWYHAGPMLYGDWGTSRFYVLGLALFYALHASFWYVFAVGLLVAAVGWAYTIICRCYPDGGGVYSAARHTSKQLAVVGALLLFADYIVTASISAYDGIRYMGMDKGYVPYVAMGAILLVGLINFIGPKRAGAVALIITLATLFLTVILVIFAIPHLPDGIRAIHRPTEPFTIQWSHFVAVVLALSGVEAIANMTGIMVPPITKTAGRAIWPVLCEVVIFNIIFAIAMNALPKAGYDLGPAPAAAFAEVESIKESHPDWQTNTVAQAEIKHQADILGIAPTVLTSRSDELKERQDRYSDVIMRVMAEVYVDPHMTIHVNGHAIGLFSLACGFIFGLLLLSAVNTAVADMVSIQYVMSRDTELPHVLTKLNVFGVPWYALIAAVGLPIIVLNIFQDINTLGNLYAVGVVGAIAINLGSCSINKEMPVKNWERVCLSILTVIMVVIELTLIYEKPDARYFALVVLLSGLIARFFTKNYPGLSAIQRSISLLTAASVLVAIAAVLLTYRDDIAVILHGSVAFLKAGQSSIYFIYIVSAIAFMVGGNSAVHGLLYLAGKAIVAKAAPLSIPAAITAQSPAALTAATVTPAGTPAEELDMDRPHVMVATRGAPRLLEFASNYTKDVGGILFVLFVRQINVAFSGPLSAPTIGEDPEALDVFTMAADFCRKQGVAMVPIYIVSSDVPYSILDFAATYNVKALLMGVSRKATLLRALQGDTLTAVADQLPNDIPLLIHA